MMSFSSPDRSPQLTCSLCQRQGVELTRHHLIPRTYHRDFRKKKTISREILNRTVPLCPPCHRHIHRTLTEKEMAHRYYTLDRLQTHPEIERFVEWIRTKRPDLRVKFEG